MTNISLCACGKCQKQVTPQIGVQDDGGAWWRFSCVARAAYLLRDMQNLPAPALSLLISILRENGRNELADLATGALPFDE